MELKPGKKLQSSVCATEVIVVKAPKTAVDLRCGGQAMVEPGGERAGESVDAAFGGGTLIGKRYADEDSGLEVLCTKGGEGGLSLGDQPLLQKDAKPLPSSD